MTTLVKVAAAVFLCIPLPGLSQEADPTELPSQDQIEEIIVRGKSLIKLQAEVFKAEDNYFAAFNELNSRNEFDIRCRLEAPTRTRIKQRACRAQFVNDLEAESAKAFLRGESVNPQANISRMRLKGEALTTEMRALLVEHPELVAALNAFGDAKQRFEEERERRCAGRILFCGRAGSSASTK